MGRYTLVSSDLHAHLSTRLRRSVRLATKKGSSSWLSALPALSDSGFILHKAAIRDALALRYGWPSLCTPTSVSNTAYLVPHKGSLITISPGFLAEICLNVSMEPEL